MKTSRVLRSKFQVGVVVACLLVSALVRVAAVASDKDSNTDPCRHPYPCGDEWPAELANRTDFVLKDVTSVTISSPGADRKKKTDDANLDGWLAMPTLPADDKAPAAKVDPKFPTIIFSSPYLTLGTTPKDPSWWGESPPPEATFDSSFNIPPKDLIARGFALLYVSVRGTGRSGGCMELFGPNEQQDQVEIVKWVSSSEWSNGSVAMGGLSYLSGTAWAGAVRAGEQGVEALKTTITTGLVTDLYTLFHTPQGTMNQAAHANIPATIASTTSVPPIAAAVSDAAAFLADPRSEDPQPNVNWAGIFAERACPATLEWLTLASHSSAGDRLEGFWEARHLIKDFPKVTAASLIAHGFLDYGHHLQEDDVWEALRSPKWQVEGLWRHRFPSDKDIGPSTVHETHWWTNSVLAWLDYWLKGIGSPPRLNIVDYQDTDSNWHEARSWPPNTTNEALHLAPQGLALRPDARTSTFVSAPDPRAQGIYWSGGPALYPQLAGSVGLCSEPINHTSVKFVSPPVEEPAFLAGNPDAHLYLSSDMPGGLVTVDVAIVSPEFNCIGRHDGARWISTGSADLEFYSNRYTRTPFPVGQPTRVRLDLSSVHDQLKRGDRIAVVVSRGDPLSFAPGSPTYQPKITIHSGPSGSRIVLPIEGKTFEFERRNSN